MNPGLNRKVKMYEFWIFQYVIFFLYLIFFFLFSIDGEMRHLFQQPLVNQGSCNLHSVMFDVRECAVTFTHQRGAPLPHQLV